MTGDDLPPQALAALRAGRKIEAIKQLRMATGVSLQEAKRRIDAYDDGESPPAKKAASFAIPTGAIEAMKRGNRLEALDIIRKAAGGSVAEAIALVDHLQRTAPPPKVGAKPSAPRTAPTPGTRASPYFGPHLAPGEVPRSSGGRAWAAIALAAVALVVVALLMR